MAHEHVSRPTIEELARGKNYLPGSFAYDHNMPRIRECTECTGIFNDCKPKEEEHAEEKRLAAKKPGFFRRFLGQG